MQFDIAKVILWPKDGTKAVRIVEFVSGRLNIISGVSRTGKSAIIPIIDYCLGADKCTIPTGIIRQKTGWFGVIVRTPEGEKLIARREPELQQATDDMHIEETAGVLTVPATISKNANRDLVKQRLDHLAGLTKLSFSIEDPAGGLGRPSFRDLAAFVFQPQNIVANPNVLFYKADTVEHRQKLRSIFPYVLGAINAETMAARHELHQLERELRRKEQELAEIRRVSERWRATALARVAEAKELGLLPSNVPRPTEFETSIEVLRAIVAAPRSELAVTTESLSEGIEELNHLNQEEETLAQELSRLRKRYAEMEELRANTATYKDAIQLQRERLHVSRWLSDQVSTQHECPVCGSGLDRATQKLSTLVTSLEELERTAGRIDAVPPSFDREMERVRSQIGQSTERLAGIRIRQTALETQSESARRQQYSRLAASRFTGRLESDLKTLASVGQDGELTAEVATLRDRVLALQRMVAEAEIQTRMRRALGAVNLMAGRILPLLDAERPNDPLSLSETELTIRVQGTDREDFLWEIGSGSNWLSYHVAVSLALQQYFVGRSACPVPSFIVYDQPSQVYFPKRLAEKSDDEIEEPTLRDQDVEAVRKVFSGMATAHPEAKLAVAVAPANWRKSRRLMTIQESAGRSTVTNRAPHRQRFWLQFL
jgi:regulator of replication initiation timing